MLLPNDIVPFFLRTFIIRCFIHNIIQRLPDIKHILLHFYRINNAAVHYRYVTVHRHMLLHQPHKYSAGHWYLSVIFSNVHTGWAKKVSPDILHITLSNTGRCSKSFHWHNLHEIYKKHSLNIPPHLKCVATTTTTTKTTTTNNNYKQQQQLQTTATATATTTTTTTTTTKTTTTNNSNSNNNNNNKNNNYKQQQQQ